MGDIRVVSIKLISCHKQSKVPQQFREEHIIIIATRVDIRLWKDVENNPSGHDGAQICLNSHAHEVVFNFALHWKVESEQRKHKPPRQGITTFCIGVIFIRWRGGFEGKHVKENCCWGSHIVHRPPKLSRNSELLLTTYKSFTSFKPHTIHILLFLLPVEFALIYIKWELFFFFFLYPKSCSV